MDTENLGKPSYTTEYLIAAGYIILLCLAFAFFYLYFFLTYAIPKPKEEPVNTFATSLPPITPTPHFSFTDLQDKKKIFEDNFSDDANHWTMHKDFIDEKVVDGQLVFESVVEDNYAFTGCQSCPALDQPYFLQVDLATKEAVTDELGIVFNLDYSTDSFFVFQINSESRKYYFYHNVDDAWSLRAAGETSHIKPSPESNTLGVYADHGKVDLYVNGHIIESYYQANHNFYEGDFSFYVDDWRFQVFADNLIIYDMEQK